MRSCHSVCSGIVGSFLGQGMRRSRNDSTRGSCGRASGCGRGSRDLDRTLADGLGVQRTIVRRVATYIPPRREVYRVNQGRMARISGILGKIISTILIAVIKYNALPGFREGALKSLVSRREFSYLKSFGRRSTRLH
jgi:hypothetical protein